MNHPGGSAAAEGVFIFADNGAPIMATRNLSGDPRFDTNYHGATFADGEVWIQPGEVPYLLQGDGYQKVSNGDIQKGDVVVYNEDPQKQDRAHSAAVVETDGNHNNTVVEGLGGTETSTSFQQLCTAWTPTSSPQVHRKPTPDRNPGADELNKLKDRVDGEH